ncbi:hypothetical protein ACFL26_00855 [Patescibacteria group bacterium]
MTIRSRCTPVRLRIDGDRMTMTGDGDELVLKDLGVVYVRLVGMHLRGEFLMQEPVADPNQVVQISRLIQP